MEHSDLLIAKITPNMTEITARGACGNASTNPRLRNTI